MSTARVLRWIAQFPCEHRAAILAEMAYILERTYLSENRMGRFLDRLTINAELTGRDPKGFWAKTHLLDIQQRGASQRDMSALLREKLDSRGYAYLAEADSGTTSFVYLDDVICTGNHLFRDLSDWITTAPSKCSVHIIVAFLHAGGKYRALEKSHGTLKLVARDAGKKIQFTCWSLPLIEDRRFHTNSSDVLRPKGLPSDERVAAYLEELSPEIDAARAKYGRGIGLVWRSGDHVGERKFFSSGEARTLLEDQFLIAGCRIRGMCDNLGQSARPLGYQFLSTLGFGALVVTYRNCPNNCPLAWWVGDPWYPLFPRRTNTETSIQRLFE